MTTRSWIRKRFTRTSRSVRNPLVCYRPRLEALEERLAPAGGLTNTSLASLPVGAQAAVSGTLGRDDTTYAASPAGDAFTLSNPAQDLNVLLTPAAALLSSGSDTWSMALAQVGHGDIAQAVGMATVQAQQNRVTYDYGALTQWFVNGPAGLEQGFTLSQDPVGSDGSAPLVVDIRLGGSVHATVSAAGDVLTLSRSDGSTVWTYSGLEVFDASGRSLPTRLAVQSRGGQDDLVIQVDDVGAHYPLTIDPLVQQAKLTASDGAHIGWTAAMSSDGKTVVAGVGGFEKAIYVFVEPSTGWGTNTQTAILTDSGGAAIGNSVAISDDGSTVVAAAQFAHAVDVFVKPTPGGWADATQTATLTGVALGTYSVAMSSDGSTVVAGNGGGDAYVFVKPATGGWANATPNATLTASNGSNELGASVAVSSDGSTVVAAAPQANGGAGAVYLFEEPSTGGWATATQSAELTASDGASGDNLGWAYVLFHDANALAISDDGTTVVAGAPQANGGQGKVYVFAKPGTGGWATATQSAELTASDGAASDNLGYSVAVRGDGSTVVAGAIKATVGTNSNQGAAYVFGKPGTGWANATQTAKLTASDGAANNEFGSSVAISSDGSTVLAGAPGAVYVFGKQPPTLSPTALTNDGTYGTQYGQAITATEPGYTGSFTFTSTGLPNWLSLSSTGMLSGTPNAVGSFSFTITATDSGGVAVSQMYTLKVDQETLTINATSDTKTYNGSTASLQTPTLMGTIYNNEVIYSQAFQSKDVLGTGASLLVVSYSITSAASGDYVVKTNSASGTITAAGLDIYATSDSKVYNGTTTSSQMPTYQVANEPLNTLYNSDTLSGLSQSFASPNVLGSNGSTLQVNSGYLINDGNQGKDYSVTLHTASGTITARPLTITANSISKTYGQTVSFAGTEFSLGATTTTPPAGLVNSDTVSSVSLTSAGAAAGATVTSPGPNYSIIPSVAQFSVGSAANYKINYVNGTLTINLAPLSATAVGFSATAGGPFSGTVATFTSLPDKIDSATAFMAVISWGDGSTSNGVITGSNGSFSVSGSHTYADPNASPGYAVSVQISNPNTQSATANDTATVTSLNQAVGKGLAGGIGFWHNQNGQALIKSFGSAATGLTLANWLAVTFPNLYGPSTGSNNLTNQTNAQVATYFQTLFQLGGTQVQAQVLAVALNVYATTASLGGNAGVAYGFSVSATGLGARSYNVGSDGAAFGVANNTMRNVYELLLAVNQVAKNGVLYKGTSALQAQCADLFNSLNQSGSI